MIALGSVLQLTVEPAARVSYVPHTMYLLVELRYLYGLYLYTRQCRFWSARCDEWHGAQEQCMNRAEPDIMLL